MQTLKQLIEINLEGEVAPEVRERLEKDIRNLAEVSNNNWLKDQFRLVQNVEQLLLFSNPEAMK